MFIFEALAPGAMPLLRRAASVFRTIINDPIRFVGNLVRAGIQGFRQFLDNIRTHLVNGLVGWITGALSGAGLQLPERWDLRGILSLVLQILGLTWQNIRQKLLRHIPETVLTVLETTFDILLTLVRDGPAAAWQKILEQLDNLQEMVFGQIRDWVIRTVVGQAVMRIVSMLNPAGAVIQAIIAIYNTIMFVRERLQQIIQVAESFFNSIAEIAAGRIGAAATTVEQTMGRLVPVVISFLARLLGLGGISDTIRNIVARIRAPIDRALDRVVDWFVAQARRLGSAVARGARGLVARVTRWWASRKNFTAADGENHSLYFAGEERSAVLRVRSQDMTYADFVRTLRPGNDQTKVASKNRAEAIARSIDQIRNTAATGATPADVERGEADKAARINQLLDELKTHTAVLMGPTIPPSFTGNPNGATNSAGYGVTMTVKPLTNVQRREGSEPTSAANTKYAQINERRDSPGGASYYIKGHLLNQQLGGLGAWVNLTPLSRQGNAQHERQVESIVKRTVDLPAVVEYTVVPRYGSQPNRRDLLDRIAGNANDDANSKRVKREIVESEDWVPLSLEVKAYIIDDRSQRRNTILDRTLTNPVSRRYEDYFLSNSPRPQPVNLSVSPPELLVSVPGVNAAIADRIKSARDSLRRRFLTYEEFAQAAGIGSADLQAIRGARHITLY
jgi:hypothetical protein